MDEFKFAFGISEAARAIGISTTALHTAIKRGEITPKMNGGCMVIPSVRLQSYLAALPDYDSGCPKRGRGRPRKAA